MVDGGKRSFLDSIPGWGGYRDRGRRRESDRLLREKLARDYGEVADDLGRFASRLADDRKLRAIRYVDNPQGRLKHFINRLRTATYGYAGLFSDRPVDADALDQIAAFDESLGEGLYEIARAADALKAADPDDDAFRDRSEELSDLIEKLHSRFDRRSELIDTGQARPEEEISSLLATTPSQSSTPTAYQLHDGDGITYQNINYSVIGRITIDTASASWRDFQLQGGAGQSWLRVPADPGGQFYWCHRVESDESAGDQELTTDSKSFALSASHDATSEVIGTGGASGNREMTVYLYSQAEGDSVLSVYHWRTDELWLVGEPIDATALELWSREGGRAI
ncbi:hypothetical protein BH23CHL2_BH23CHL2_26250 [soil metagenome]